MQNNLKQNVYLTMLTLISLEIWKRQTNDTNRQCNVIIVSITYVITVLLYQFNEVSQIYIIISNDVLSTCTHYMYSLHVVHVITCTHYMQSMSLYVLTTCSPCHYMYSLHVVHVIICTHYMQSVTFHVLTTCSYVTLCTHCMQSIHAITCVILYTHSLYHMSTLLTGVINII